ncbi:transcriptional regulator [Rhodococcus sp. OK611]|uniref:AfsR/SARP family transcriptional regulator n=1 Tax=unclassified Rhodococcus (in: high G+C Gram-positive bacteria) TaxID=192944 RepID=UPI000BD9A63C|nr:MULTISPECIES: bacterial transcriptional activator domain-containing protein [unclassified Rhodococcus (in: high G+C Gram-positive bacteria)]PTR39014.1 transcriptional regulator [Rhodococcus sp. OK611]SNX92800.1 Transcriptional regulatory protein, C terminal [Rhodococcus sp. OK270]
MSADRLLAQVWHDLDQPKLSSLHVAISKLRDLLSPDRARREDGVLVRDGSRYLLSAARGSVDVARFEELVRIGAEVAETSADAAAAAYLEALSLWRGSPYADIAGSEFTTPEIARLTAMHLETRRSLLEVGWPAPGAIRRGGDGGGGPDRRAVFTNGGSFGLHAGWKG